MTSRTKVLVAIAGVIIVGLGALVGFAIAGDDDDTLDVTSPSTSSTSTTETSVSSTTTTTSPDETSTTTSTEPTTSSTSPDPTIAPPPPTVPPSTAPHNTTAPSTTQPPPPYRSSISTVTAEQLGSSYTPGMGCAEPDALRMITLTHWGNDGAILEGRIVVAAGRAEGVDGVFRQLYANRFPVQRMVPIDAYGGDDQASMRANNTSGYNCRTVSGSSKLSNHAFGEAIDVNPLVNPYVKGGTVDPPEGRPWADRSRRDPGMIHADDPTVRAFAAAGWKWGGYWSSGKDYQHFSTSGT